MEVEAEGKGRGGRRQNFSVRKEKQKQKHGRHTLQGHSGARERAACQVAGAYLMGCNL